MNFVSKLLSGTAATSLLFLSAPFALAQDKASVTWWYEAATPENQAHLQTLIVDAFNAVSDEHELSIDIRGAELDRQLRIALLSGSGPDVVYTPGPAYIAAMAQAGQLLPLDDYAASFAWTDRVLPVFLDLGTYDGQLFALPKTYETMGLFYNVTLFNERGWTVPTSIAEYEALADVMLAEGLVPFAAGNTHWRPVNEHHVSMALNSIAGPDNVALALQGELAWTAPPFVEAITTLNDWWQAGYFGPDYFSLNGEQSFAMVATGEAGFAPTGTWQFQLVDRFYTDSGAEVGFAGFPSAEGVPYPVYALGIGTTFSIAATSQNPDGAAAVIDYVFTEEFYGAMNSVWQGEWNTPLVDLSNVTISADVLPLYAESMDALAEAVAANQYGYTSWTFLPPATNSYLVSGIEEVWLGSTTVDDYLAQLDTLFQQELAEGKVPSIPPRRD